MNIPNNEPSIIKNIILLNSDAKLSELYGEGTANPTDGDTTPTDGQSNEVTAAQSNEVTAAQSNEVTAAQSNEVNRAEGADGSDVVKEALATNNNYVFVPFADGGLFRYQENPNKPGTWVLTDSRNTPVAVTGEKAIADFLCRGAHCLVATMMTMQQPQVLESKIVKPI